MLNSLFLLGIPNGGELLLIVFVIVLLFGAKRIPELFKGLGSGVREFKDATKETPPAYRDQAPYPQDNSGQNYPPQGYPQQPNGYQPQYPQQGYPQQNGYPQQQNGYPQQQNGYPQQQNGYQQPPNGYQPQYPQPDQPGYQQPTPPARNPNDPSQQLS